MSPKVSETHKRNRRNEILAASSHVFESKGYKSVTMKDIVEATGMSRGGVYMYFSSTEEILRAILEWDAETSVTELDKLFDKAIDGRSAVSLLLEGITGSTSEDVTGDTLFPAVVEYILDTKERSEETALFLQTRYLRMLNRFVDVLKLGVDRGFFAPQLPLPTIARIVLTWADGLLMHRNGLGNETVDFAAQVAAMKELMFSFLHVDADRDSMR